MDHMYDKLLTKGARVLIVDHEHDHRSALLHYIIDLGYQPIEAIDGRIALDILATDPPDLVFLNTELPILNAEEVIILMQENDKLKDIPVIITSSNENTESIAKCIELGADDYVIMPYNPTLLRARVKASLKKKIYHDVEKNFFRQMNEYSHNLEELVKDQVKEISQGQQATIFAMAKLAEYRDPETGQHIERMAEYCKIIATYLRGCDRYRYYIDDNYIDCIYSAAPLHDIGKVGIVDEILNKPGKLTKEEFNEMKRHTVIGANTLKDVIARHPSNELVRIGIDIAEAHHEKWDGSGYPFGLSGENIPLSARILALGDVYDALVSERCYKKAFSHEEAKKIILEGRGTHFDPSIVDAFIECESDFIKIRAEFA